VTGTGDLARVLQATDAAGIPDRPTSKSAEAARLCAVKPYVLRYWETEFRSIRPQKTRSQAAPLPRKDLELLLKIRQPALPRALHDRGARAAALRELGDDERRAMPARRSTAISHQKRSRVASN